MVRPPVSGGQEQLRTPVLAYGDHGGLIINELVSNAFKHTFPDGRKGQAAHVLRIREDGVGFPEGVDFSNSPSLGLEWVNLLAKQVRGRIALRQNQGTEFDIELASP